MLRSVKSQIITATSLIIIVILSATAYFVLSQKVKEINHDIYEKAISFAELTHERIIANYENNYKSQAFAHFERELADIFSLNEDVNEVNIYNYSGNVLYKPENRVNGSLSDQELERVQHVIPSVKIKKTGRIVYLEETDNGIRFTDFNGRSVIPVNPTDQIEDVVFPFRDPNNALRSFSIRYYVSYDALASRIRSTAINIIIIALVGIVVAILIGGIVAGRITSPIRTLSEGAAKIGKGDLTTRIPVKSQNEVGMLANTFNQMAADLEKSTQELLEKEKIKSELAVAGKIQHDLLPKELPKIKNLDIAASLASAEEVGGDCYDFIPVDGTELLFYIADVTGHGVPAGLVSAINNALVPALMENYKDTRTLIVALNEILKIKTQPNVFMTMVMAKWDIASATLHYTQAGHDPILHFKSQGGVIEELKVGGTALGMLPDIEKLAKTEQVKVETNDVLVLYTDGIPEAWKNEKENFGMDRFKELVKKHASLKTAQEIHDAILKEVRTFMGSYPQADDITLIVVKRTT